MRHYEIVFMVHPDQRLGPSSPGLPDQQDPQSPLRADER